MIQYKEYNRYNCDIEHDYVVKYDYDSGIRGLKQLAKSMYINGIGDFEKYTKKFLDRMGMLSWYSGRR